MNLGLQCKDNCYQALDAGQTCEIISKIEKIRSIIGFELLDLLTFLHEASSPAHSEALLALLVTGQSFVLAKDEDACLAAPVNWAASP